MKTVIAYALVIIGIPIVTGILLDVFIMMPIVFLLGKTGKFRLPVLVYLEVFSGLGTIISAALIFYFLGATPSIAIPIIVAAEISFYFWRYKQQPQAWCSWLAGIAVGWFVIARYFLK